MFEQVSTPTAAGRNVIIICSESLVASALERLLAADTGLNVRIDTEPLRLNPGGAGAEPPVVVYDRRGPNAAERIAEFAAMNRVPVVALLAASSADAIPELFRAGVRGFVGRDAAPGELVSAVNDVAAGHVYASRDALERILQLVPPGARSPGAGHLRLESQLLTPRERDIVGLLARGMTNQEIAETLHVSLSTVKLHLGRVMTKWRVRDRRQVALYGLGLLKADQK